MTRRDLLAFLFRYKGTIVGWWVFIVLIVGVMAYFAKPTYEAMSSVLVERTRAPVITAREYNAPEMAEVVSELQRDIQEKKLRIAMAKEFDRLKESATIDNFLAGDIVE
mgnify:CR=1 FL=1